MKKPKMILFDYGQTLINEHKFNGVKGQEAVLQYAIKNKYNMSAEQLEKAADLINKEVGRFAPGQVVEIPNRAFTNYLYELYGIELSIDAEEIDRVFWDAASPGEPTDGIEEFLRYLDDTGIRTGVISNISYCGNALADRINRCIPKNKFEFIMATSEYMYRKPNKRIFELALEKAGLTAEDVWFVGDQYACDIVGAVNAGLFPVWYIGAMYTQFENMKDILEVTSWIELKEFIKIL